MNYIDELKMLTEYGFREEKGDGDGICYAIKRERDGATQRLWIAYCEWEESTPWSAGTEAWVGDKIDYPSIRVSDRVLSARDALQWINKQIPNGLPNPEEKHMCSASQLYLRFKSKNQSPLVMIYRLWFDENDEVCDGRVLFNSVNWIGI